MTGFEENEISKNANGGTELSKRIIAKAVPEELANEFQVICSRTRDLQDDKIRILWVHDTAEDPELSHLRDPASRAKYHKIVFVSHWQMYEFINKLGIPMDDKLAVIGNPIYEIPLFEKPTDKIRLIYASTPQRGLELLIPVFEALCKKYDNLHLDVYSSFKIYGWEDADKQFEPLYDAVRAHPNMTYHGFADQRDVRSAFQQAHILAYPSIWRETSCRVLIEAMSAGLLCVHPNLGALAETSGGLTSMYQYHEEPTHHIASFMRYLDNAIQVVPGFGNFGRLVKAYADTRYGADRVCQEWNILMQDLKTQYPTAESRAMPKATFSYRSS